MKAASRIRSASGAWMEVSLITVTEGSFAYESAVQFLKACFEITEALGKSIARRELQFEKAFSFIATAEGNEIAVRAEAP